MNSLVLIWVLGLLVGISILFMFSVTWIVFLVKIGITFVLEKKKEKED